MPLVMNCLDKPQTACVGGNYFSFKPNQIRAIHSEDIARHIAASCAEQGFVVLPDAQTDPETGEEIEGIAWTQTETGKKAVLEAKARGVESYCNKLRQVVYNMQVSLRQDLEKKGIKADPRVFASEGELRALEELVKYQKSNQDVEQHRLDRIKQLEKQLSLASKG